MVEPGSAEIAANCRKLMTLNSNHTGDLVKKASLTISWRSLSPLCNRVTVTGMPEPPNSTPAPASPLIYGVGVNGARTGLSPLKVSLFSDCRKMYEISRTPKP